METFIITVFCIVLIYVIFYIFHFGYVLNFSILTFQNLIYYIISLIYKKLKIYLFKLTYFIYYIPIIFLLKYLYKAHVKRKINIK